MNSEPPQRGGLDQVAVRHTSVVELTGELSVRARRDDSGDPTPSVCLSEETNRTDGLIAHDHSVDNDAQQRNDLLARLDRFADVIDSEVGDTNLTRVRNFERETGLRQLYLKLEGTNPSGTHKDRIAFAQTMDALRRGYDAMCLAGDPNYVVAMAMACSLAKLRCVVFLPRGGKFARMEELEKYPVETVWADDGYESAIHGARVHAEREGMYDSVLGGVNSTVQLSAYGQIAFEIYDELRDAPAVVAVPVANGTTLAGIYRGFLALYRRGKTSRIPRMVAGSSYGRNPIVQAFQKGLPHCQRIKPVRNKPLAEDFGFIDWSVPDIDVALEAVRTSEGWADHVSDRVLASYSRMLRDLDGLEVVSESCAGLIALLTRHRVEPFRGDRYVAIITGNE